MNDLELEDPLWFIN